VGVDFSDSFVAAVRAVARGRRARCEVVAAPAGTPGPTGGNAAAAIRAAASSRRAVLSAALPAHDALVRRLSAPVPSIRRARRVMPSLLDVQLPFPLESCAVEYFGFERETAGGVGALAAVARDEQVDARLAALAAAGLDPPVLDHEALAIWEQSLRERPPAAPDEPRFVAYAGTDRMTVAAGRGQRLLAVHGARWGAADARRAGDADREPAACAAWAERVRRALPLPAADGGPAAKWFWCGPATERPGFAARLEQALSAGSRMTFERHDAPAAFLARALAVRAATAPTPCNLRRGARTHPALAAAAARAGFRQAASAAAAGGMLLVLALGVPAALDARARAVQDELSERAMALTGLPRIGRGLESRMAADAARRRAAEWAPVERAFSPSMLLTVRRTLDAAAAAGLHVRLIECGATGAVVRGTSPDWNACARADAALRDEGYQTRLTREDAGADERVGFEVRGGRP
jgi:hypothetical protein